MKQARGRVTHVLGRPVATCLMPCVLAGALSLGCGKSENDAKVVEAPSGGARGGAGASSHGASTAGGGVGMSAGVGSVSDAGAAGALDSPPMGGTASGGQGPKGGGGSSAGGEPPVDTGGAPPTTGQSQPPVKLSNTAEATSGAVLADLEVTHSHFYVDPSAKIPNTWTWLAVVKNNRKDLACDLSVEGTFVAAGSSPIKIFAEVAAVPYRRTDTSSVFRCIPAGEVGVATGLAVDGVPAIAPTAVTEVRYAIVGTLGPDYVPGDWVSLSGVEIAETGGRTVVSGTLTNGESSMPWWEADVFPATNAGLPLTQFILKDTHTQLGAGATWEFQTAPYDGVFAKAYVFVRHGRAK